MMGQKIYGRWDFDWLSAVKVFIEVPLKIAIDIQLRFVSFASDWDDVGIDASVYIIKRLIRAAIAKKPMVEIGKHRKPLQDVVVMIG